MDDIAAARRLIYIETQYFSSRRIHQVLLAVGLRQAQIVEQLRRAARHSTHHPGIYYSLCHGAAEGSRTTHIHSTLLRIDDRFLSVGSANLTNRSMALDSELRVSWEATDADRRLRRALRRLRVSLLAEHSGLSGPSVRDLVRVEGLVARLNALAARPPGRLQPVSPPTSAQRAVMDLVDPQEFPFDVEIPEAGEHLKEPDDQKPPRRPSLWRRLSRALHRRRAKSARPVQRLS